MEKITIDEIIEACDGKLLQGDLNTQIDKISTDTRTLEKGALFIALKGKNFDGHNFLEECLNKGAVGAIISDEISDRLNTRFELLIPNAKFQHPMEIVDTTGRNLILIKVSDTLIALQDIARYYRNKFSNLKVIGITGSNGKTTTKEITAEVLSVKFKTFKSAGNLNNEIGLPLNLLELSNEYKAGVFELGANDFGEIKLLADILTPQIAVITNIGNTHLELLKDINGVGKLKWELIDSLGEGSFAILNFDDLVLQEKLRQCEKGELECKCKFLTYGLVEENKPLPKNCGFSEKADVWATDIKLFGLEGSEFVLHYREFSKKIKLNIAGNYNIYNSLAAAAVGFALDLSIDEVAKGLENFKNTLPNRMQIINVHGIRIINDTYNANLQSMIEAVKFLNKLNNCKRKILILGDMLELGEKSKDLHENLGEHIAKSSLDLLYTVGKDSEYIGFGAKENGFSEENIFHFSQKKDLIEKIKDEFREEDTIFIKGSRGMGMEEIVGFLKDKGE